MPSYGGYRKRYTRKRFRKPNYSSYKGYSRKYTAKRRLLGPTGRSNIEKKIYVNDGTTLVQIGYDNVFALLMNGFQQGTDQQERVGNKVRNLYAEVRIQLQTLATGPGYSYMIRVVVDKQTNGGAIVVGGTTSPSGRYMWTNGSTNVYPWNLTDNNNSGRYVTLWATTGEIVQSTATLPSFKLIEKHIPMNFQTIYNGSGATIGAIASNSIYLIITNDQTNASAYGNVRYQTKLVFTDD